jgi:hypothetical protein
VAIRLLPHENEQEEEGTDSIQQYFAYYDGLGVSVPIVDASVLHHFYGWAFVHRTSLC